MRDFLIHLIRLHDAFDDSFEGALIAAIALFAMLVAGLSIGGAQ